jgi:hypothetical protein
MHWQCAARCCVSCALTTKGGPLCCLGVFRCSSVSCVWKIASRSCRVANTVRSACSGSPNLATANARVRGWCVGMMSCDESGLRGHSAACQQSRVGGCYCPAGRCVDGGGGRQVRWAVFFISNWRMGHAHVRNQALPYHHHPHCC